MDVKGKHKELTLVGEVHRYNSEDKKVAENLVLSNHFFAHECNQNTSDEMNGIDRLYDDACSTLSALSSFYSRLGSGREHPNIARMAIKGKNNLIALENGWEIFEDLSPLQRLVTLAMNALKMPLAPLCYYSGKDEPKITQEYLNEKRGLFWEENVTKRDVKMAKNLALWLQQPEIDSLLATTGLAHTPGIIKHLKANPNIKLEEIK